MSFKFFRKYNKWLLPIGGSFLMVLFLVPQAVDLVSPDRQSFPVATLSGREITIGDMEQAAGQMRVVRALLPGVEQFGVLHPYGLPQGENAGAIWIMLRHLADAARIPASRAQATQLIAGEQAAARVAEVATVMKVPEEAVREALRDYLAIVTYKHLAMGFVPPNLGPRLSEVGLRNLARRFGTSVDLEYVALRADWFVDQVAPPGTEAMEAHFQKYRDIAPGAGEHGFGYQLPWRVKLAFIAVPFQRVLEQVEVDEIEVRQRFDENPQQYAPEVPPEPGAEADEATRQAYQEARAARDAWDAMSANEQYRQAREEIRRTLRQRKAANRQREAIQFIESELRAALRDVPIDPETGLRRFDQAEDYQPLALDTLAEAIQADDRFGFLPDVVRLENRYRRAEQVAALRGFGDSFLVRTEGGEQRRLPMVTAERGDVDYLSSLPEAGGRDLPGGLEQLQAGVPSRPVLDPQGTRYIFRVTDVRPAEAPESLEAVRAEVEMDLMRLRAYERMRDQREEYVSVAREHGLSGLSEQLNDEVPASVSVGSWTGVSQQQLAERLSRDFARRVFDEVVRRVEEAGSLADAGDERRFGTVPYPPELALYVLRVSGFQPISAERFAEMRPTLASQWVRMQQLEMLGGLQANPFSFEQLKARTGWRDVEPERESDGDGNGAGDAPATPAGEAPADSPSA